MQVVTVDPTRCQGHARCFAFAPDHFDFDDEGYAFVPDDRNKFEVLSDDMKLAVANCPERAIIITNVTS